MPVIATIGMESSMAVPMPVTRFVAPGPDVPMHTPTLPRHAGVAVGGVGAALLVADEDVPQLRVVAEDVVQRQDHAAGVAEEDVDALPEQGLADDVGADPRADAALARADGDGRRALVEHLALGALDRRGVLRAGRRAGGSAARGRASSASRLCSPVRRHVPSLASQICAKPPPLGGGPLVFGVVIASCDRSRRVPPSSRLPAMRRMKALNARPGSSEEGRGRVPRQPRRAAARGGHRTSRRRRRGGDQAGSRRPWCAQSTGRGR